MFDATVIILSTLFAQVGARQLQFQWTDAQKRLVYHPITQALFLFALFFLTTRSALWALAIVATYYLLVKVLLNETHPYNVLPRDWLKAEGFLAEEPGSVELYYQNMPRIVGHGRG